MPGPLKVLKKSPRPTKNRKATVTGAMAQKSFRKAKEDAGKHIRENIRSDNTNNNYRSTIERTRKWVREFVASQGQSKGREDDDDESHEDVEMDPEFPTCLDNKPRKCTPEAITMFMAWKCFDEQKGKATAVQIHAAWKHHYKHL